MMDTRPTDLPPLPRMDAVVTVDFDAPAAFSDDRRHRYWLRRDLGGLAGQHYTGRGHALFVMLNPSTADETTNDPTIRRCLGFAAREGFATAGIVNLWSLRSTDPKALRPAVHDWHADRHAWQANAATIDAAIGWADTVVAAWGATAADLIRRGLRMPAVSFPCSREGRPLVCLGTTKTGAPRHPLYVAAKTDLVPWDVDGWDVGAWLAAHP